MKRIISISILLCLLLCGCGQRLKEPVTFYYLNANFEEDMSTVILSEQREASGHRHDLSYLMALYLMGPTEEDLRSPIPRGTRIYTSAYSEDSVELNLSDTDKTLTDSEFSLACACLSLTCLDLTEAQSVTISSGSRSLTMTRDALLLSDSILSVTEQQEETQ